MPRKRKNDNMTDDIGMEEKKGSKLMSILIGILIIAVWLIIFAALIKFDVGGFGSSVMRPIFKDVPVINKILPDINTTEDEVSTQDYPYKSMAEAIEYIKKLEKQLAEYKDSESASSTQIADLQAEIERLKIFEESQEAFEQQKKEYYDEVVLGESAIDPDNYRKYYEEIEPDYATELYKQVAEQHLYQEQYKDLSEAYTSMKPAKAAAALYEMTGDIDIIVGILRNMDVAPRAKILDALSDLDTVFCAKITASLAP